MRTTATLIATDVGRDHGTRVILDRVSLTVGPGSRVGVVGPNGSGKSTFLRILAGLDRLDRGTLRRDPPSLSAGHLAQERDAFAGERLIDYLARRTGVAAASLELDVATAALADDAGRAADHADALDRFLALGGADFDARVGAVCADVGLAADGDRPVETLSGGEAGRARLAALLLSRFDVLLLDEPTNDLDFDGLDRLEAFVAQTPASVVVVSHDRAFLDTAVDRVLELDEHTRTASEFAGGWSAYLEGRAVVRAHEREAYERYKTKRDGLARRAQRQREWAAKGAARAARRPSDNDKHVRRRRIVTTERLAAKARASRQAMERLSVVDKPWEGWDLRLSVAETRRSGDVVATLDEAVIERDGFTLGPVDVDVRWGERVAIVGPNGSGKSTLLGALLGRLPVTSGRQRVGPSVVIGELDQARRLFPANESLLDGFVAVSGASPQEARSTLAKLGLGAQAVMRSPATLSPGERTRASLAVLAAKGVNCLVLDEPTNHLDLPAIEQLEQAIDDYDGTLLLVSHDRWLLDSVRLTRTIELG